MTTPTSPITVDAGNVAADILKYGAPVVGVLEAVENIPGLLPVSGPAQAVIAGAITVLTAVLSVLSQVRVGEAVAAVKASRVKAK